jgi:hypothetical protein
VVLNAEEGTQGREMKRKIRIASALALAGFLSVSAPLAASAGTPMLSGYGGPGAGEQAIIGSTLLGGPRGGAGSGGSSWSSSSSSNVARDSNGRQATNSAGAGRATGTSPSGSSSSSKSAPVIRGGAPRPARSDASHAGGAGVYVYPSAPASAQGGSSVIGISGRDILPLIGIMAMLGLIGLLTVGLARLQPWR